MKVSTQQLLVAALAGGFIQEALARALPSPAVLSITDSTTGKLAISDIAAINKRRDDGIVPLGSNLLPRVDDDNGDDGDSSLVLFERDIIARGVVRGGHEDGGHPSGSGVHDGTTTNGNGGTTSGGDSQSGTVGGLTSGDETTGGLTSGEGTTGGKTSGDQTTGGLTSSEGTTGGKTSGDETTGGLTSGEGTKGGLTSGSGHDQPVGPAAVCKRDNCKGYNAAGYPNQPKGFSKADDKTLARLESQATPQDKNSADAYKGRYQKEQNKFAEYRADPAQEAKDESAMLKKFQDNYSMVKQERKALSDQEIKDATGLGIKNPGKLQVYDLFSKTKGKQDQNRMAEILVSDDGSTIVASYTFAKFDGNLNKLDNKGNPVADGKGGFVLQSKDYIDAHRLPNSNVNWAFIHKITNGDKAKARGINFWMREHIINKGTIAQVYRSHREMGWGSEIRGKFTYKGDSKNPKEIEEYKALMGTENLSPVGFMYADHMQYFGGRYPLEIYTFPFDETNIWAKIGPVEGKLPKA